MNGRRVYEGADGTFAALEPGDYILIKHEGVAPILLYWPPGAELGPWHAHVDKRITEHEDGTVSVSPSILCVYAKLQAGKPGSWHGFLERGIWRQV